MLCLPKIIKKTDDYIEVFVLKEIESLNKFMPSKVAVRNCKRKRVDYNFLAEQWAKYKRQWAGALSIFPLMDKEKKIVDTTIISSRRRLMDVENLYGGSKPIRDFLQTRGWLYDDSPKWGDLQCLQEIAPKEQVGTTIILRTKNDDSKNK